MSFIKDVINDFTKSDQVLNAESVRRQAWSFLIFGIAFPILFLVYSFFYEDDHTIPIRVTNYSYHLADTAISTSFGNFSNEHEGTLHLKPSVLNYLAFSSLGVLNMVDFIFFIYVGIVLFKALRKIDEEKSFRVKVSAAYKKVALGCLWMWCIKQLFDIITSEFFRFTTNRQFYLVKSPMLDSSYFMYVFFSGIILSFVYFMNKGIALQEDNDLTI